MPPYDTQSDDHLVVGARAIAEEIFGGRFNPRQVYRMLETDPNWPAFKLAGKWVARPGAMHEEIRRREQRPLEPHELSKPA
jgi:hypothetical protein